jgi:hypothetical protein
MKSRWWWVRVARGVAVAVVILVLGLTALVHIQQRVLRWRAERLLADIRAIEMGKSTWADAQRVMNRWGAWGMWDGPCSAESCAYQIAIRDGSHALSTYFWTGTRSITRSEGHPYGRWELGLYSLLGGRVSQVYASIRVDHGIIWTKSYTVFTARDLLSDDVLIADAEGRTRFTPDLDWSSLRHHLEYSISASGPCAGCRDGACTVCAMIESKFTPFTDRVTSDELFDFNLDCITKWLRCNEPREIMPAAWRLYQKDDPGQNSDSWDWPNCRVPVEAIVRDNRFALRTRVEEVKVSTEEDGRIRYEARLRALANLKGDAMKAQSELAPKLERMRLGWSDTVLPGGVKASDVKAGDQMILLFEELPAADMIGFADSLCSYVPDTAENRAAVQRGIERDALVEGR